MKPLTKAELMPVVKLVSFFTLGDVLLVGLLLLAAVVGFSIPAASN